MTIESFLWQIQIMTGWTAKNYGKLRQNWDRWNVELTAELAGWSRRQCLCFGCVLRPVLPTQNKFKIQILGLRFKFWNLKTQDTRKIGQVDKCMPCNWPISNFRPFWKPEMLQLRNFGLTNFGQNYKFDTFKTLVFSKIGNFILQNWPMKFLLVWRFEFVIQTH